MSQLNFLQTKKINIIKHIEYVITRAYEFLKNDKPINKIYSINTKS
jgi:hypothetical protein